MIELNYYAIELQSVLMISDIQCMHNGIYSLGIRAALFLPTLIAFTALCILYPIDIVLPFVSKVTLFRQETKYSRPLEAGKVNTEETVELSLSKLHDFDPRGTAENDGYIALTGKEISCSSFSSITWK